MSNLLKIKSANKKYSFISSLDYKLQSKTRFQLKKIQITTMIILSVLIFFIACLSSKSSALQMDCICKNETFKGSSVYACHSIEFSDFNIKRLHFVNPQHTVIGKTNADVQLLLLTKGTNNITMFPEGISTFFPNVTLFYLGFSSIANITSEDLRQFPDLELFSSNMNPLTSLPGDLFKHNKHIRTIEFLGYASRSKDKTLNEIGQNLLGNLTNLKYATFWNHYCISEVAVGRDQLIDLNNRLHIMCSHSNNTPAPFNPVTNPTLPDPWNPYNPQYPQPDDKYPMPPTVPAPYPPSPQQPQNPKKNSQASVRLSYLSFITMIISQVYFLLRKL